MQGKMVGSDPKHPWGNGCGGTCCNSKQALRKNNKAVKHRERRETKQMAKEAIVERRVS